jgi:xanthine dehydrogenase large subunit
VNQAGALVHVYTDGSIMLNHGGTEMGQGLLHQGRAGRGHAFGIGLDQIKITATTPTRCPTPPPPPPPRAPTSTAWRR